jgi:hypothetical protein
MMEMRANPVLAVLMAAAASTSSFLLSANGTIFRS